FSKFLVYIGIKEKKDIHKYDHLKLQQPSKMQPKADALSKAAFPQKAQKIAELEKSFIDAIRNGDATQLEDTIIDIFEKPISDKYIPAIFLQNRKNQEAIFSNLMMLSDDKRKACIIILQNAFEDAFDDAVHARMYSRCMPEKAENFQKKAQEFQKLAELFP